MAERLLALLLCAALLAGCATGPTHPGAFAFGITGDAPYGEEEERQFLAMMARMDREALAFVVHIGDFKAGSSPCPDALYERRRAQFDGSAHPFVFTPGDNDWTDCRRTGADPIERLAALRRLLFPDRWSLGRNRLELFVQAGCAEPAAGDCRCPGLPENRYWSRAGVRFVTLHIVGSNNNFGFDARNDGEARCRDAANRAWLERAVRASERSETRALVIFIQANPWEPDRDVHRDFLGQVQAAARRVRKPVLLVHGHTHIQREDTPFKDSLGNTVDGITRLETYGSPFVGWIKVTVDPDDPQVFGIEPVLHAVIR